MHACVVSHIVPFATPRTVTRQTLLSMGLSRQEYWNELPFSPPGDLPNPGIECLLYCRQVLYHWATWEAHASHKTSLITSLDRTPISEIHSRQHTPEAALCFILFLYNYFPPTQGVHGDLQGCWDTWLLFLTPDPLLFFLILQSHLLDKAIVKTNAHFNS